MNGPITPKKVTHPSDEAVAALLDRLAWFFAQREVKQERARKAARRAKPRRRPVIKPPVQA